MDITSIIEELKKIIPTENFYIEPETSLAIINELESKYMIDTEYFLKHKTSVTEDDCCEWLNAYENALFFME